MTKYLVNKFAAIAALFAIALTSCTNTNALFGNEMVPPSQQMKTAIDSSIRPLSYIIKLDSVRTSGVSSIMPVGSYIDPLVGRTTIGLVADYLPSGFPESEREFLFGKSPEVDSMKIKLNFTSSVGDTLPALKIQVYEIENFMFDSDSIYFSNFPIEKYIKKQPFLTFEQVGDGNYEQKLPKEFYDRFLLNEYSDKHPYFSDTAFHKLFGGFYIKTEPVTMAPGQIVHFSLLASGMTLYYRNINKEGKKDTLEQVYFFQSSITTVPTTSFAVVENDYSYADAAQGGLKIEQINDTINPSQFGFMQGYAGLGTRITIPKEQIQVIKDKAKNLGYSYVAIHHAELQIALPEQNYENYNKSFPHSGLYYDAEKLDFLADYDPFRESMDQTFISILGGKLNRSNGYYGMNITSYVQRLFTGQETRYSTQMLPQWSNLINNNALLRSRVFGSESQEKPPILILTYTMLK